MTLEQIILLAIRVSIFSIVFALGLKATSDDLLYVFRRPGLLIRSILAMNVVMVVLATFAALLVDLPSPIEIALVALAMSPVPPILPGKQLEAGGTASYAIGLLVAASVAAIALVPASIVLVGGAFGEEYQMPVGRVVPIVFVSVLLPLVLGVLLQRFLPLLAERVARPISLFATALLILAVLPAIVMSWTSVWSFVGSGVVVALILFTLVGIVVGHLLGGPDEDDRTVLALATSTRHPGVAIAIANLNFPNEKAVLAVVIYHLVIGAIVAVPYVRWRRRVHDDGLIQRSGRKR